MKPIILAALLAVNLSAGLAYAKASKWFPLSSSLFAMGTDEAKGVVLTAGLDTRDNQITFRILDASGSACKDGDYSGPDPLPPYKINGKFVKILSSCINGNQLIAPETPEGRKYLYDQVMSGKTVTIETDTGPTLHFKGAFPPALQKKLRQAQSAM